MSIFIYALVLQHRNQKSLKAVIDQAQGGTSSLYYGNMAYFAFLKKRIFILRISLIGLLLILGLSISYTDSLHKSKELINNEIIFLFCGLWGVFFFTLIIEFLLIDQYKEKSRNLIEDENLIKSFKIARFFLNHLNKLINLISLSCLSLLIAIF